MDIWKERYRTLTTLKGSLDYTINLANNIKRAIGSAEECIPERLAGYVNSLLRYQKSINTFWDTLYSANEYYEAQDAEAPALTLPPNILLDADGIPYSKESGVSIIPYLEDNEASVGIDESNAPGVANKGSEIGLTWFANLVNIINNYVPERSDGWNKIWSLIRDGYGVVTRTNAWLGTRFDGDPIPDFVGHPDLVKIQTVPANGTVIHDQTFEYGKGEIGLRVYKTNKVLLFEVKIFGNSAMSSLPIVGQVLGKTYIDDEDVSMIKNVKCPILHRGYESFEYGLFDLYFDIDSSGLLILKLTGTGFTGSELACNCTYTVPLIFDADANWASTSKSMWGIGATKSNTLRQYFISYAGGQPKPPVINNPIGLDNIDDCVFGVVMAKKFILSEGPAHAPSSYEGTKIAYADFNIIVFDTLVCTGYTLTQEDAHAPSKDTSDPLVVETIGTAVLPGIKANKFMLCENPTLIALGDDDMDYRFDFKIGEVSFSHTSDNGEIYPPSYKPERDVMFGMHGNDSEGSIDVMNMFQAKDTNTRALGLYAHAGNKNYTVHNYVGLHTTVTGGVKVWEKLADMFSFTVYRDCGLLVYSFVAYYSDNGLDKWDDGTHRIITVGELPRNLCPQNHTVIQVGKCSFLTVLTNGAVMITVANTEAPFENAEFAGYAIATTETKELKSKSLNIPKIDKKLPKEELKRNRFEGQDDKFDYYDMPGANIGMMTLDENNGVCYMFNYQLGNLRLPIFDKDGDPLTTVDDVEEMFKNSKTRVKLGDGTVLRFVAIDVQTEGFTSRLPASNILLYFSVCEFLWAIPQIEHLMDEGQQNHDELVNILQDWDGITVSEYFERIQQHNDNIAELINLATVTMEDVGGEAYMRVQVQ